MPVKIMSELVCLDCGGSRPLWQSPEYRKQMVFLAVGDRHPAASRGLGLERGLGEDRAGGWGLGRRIISKKKSLLFLISHTWGS